MATSITERLSGIPTVAGSPTDLAAIEDLSGTGVPERTGANSWLLRPISGAGNAWSPEITGALSLGTSELPWSDLFLAVGVGFYFLTDAASRVTRLIKRRGSA